jgi:hypothetical protein
VSSTRAKLRKSLYQNGGSKAQWGETQSQAEEMSGAGKKFQTPGAAL